MDALERAKRLDCAVFSGAVRRAENVKLWMILARAESGAKVTVVQTFRAFDIIYQAIMASVGVAAVSMAVMGTSYVGRFRWNPLSRLLFFGSFFGFIIPSGVLDIYAAAATGLGIIATPQAWRAIIDSFGPRSARRSTVANPPTVEGDKE